MGPGGRSPEIKKSPHAGRVSLPTGKSKGGTVSRGVTQKNPIEEEQVSRPSRGSNFLNLKLGGGGKVPLSRDAKRRKRDEEGAGGNSQKKSDNNLKKRGGVGRPYSPLIKREPRRYTSLTLDWLRYIDPLSGGKER